MLVFITEKEKGKKNKWKLHILWFFNSKKEKKKEKMDNVVITAVSFTVLKAV